MSVTDEMKPLALFTPRDRAKSKLESLVENYTYARNFVVSMN